MSASVNEGLNPDQRGPASPTREGAYNPRPHSPLVARVRITAPVAEEEGTPRVSAQVDVQVCGDTTLGCC